MDRILSLIEHYGYLVVLFGVMLESTGVPLPGETILLAAGVLVQRGHLDLDDTIAFGVFGALVAGISRMRWLTFLFYNALGGAVWATAVVLAGYFLGSSLGLVERWLGRATLVLALVVAVAVGFYLAYRWASRNRARLAGSGEAVLAYSSVARLLRRYDAQLRWLLRRLTPGQYLGLHLTVGLLAAAGGLWLFGGLVEDL